MLRSRFFFCFLFVTAWPLSAAKTWAAGGEADPLVIVGSDPFRPLVKQLADAYRKRHPGAVIRAEGGGSEAAIAALRGATATIASLARPALPDEVAWVRKSRKKALVGIPVAMDALVVFVRPDHPLRSISVAAIRNILSDKVYSWEDLGVTVEGTALRRHCPQCEDETLRRAPIVLYLPPVKSGPAGVLKTLVLRDTDYPLRGKRFTPRDLVHAVAADANGIGMGEWDYTEGVRVLGIRADADSPPVFPSAQTIQSRSYPLAHYLYFYFVGQPSGLAKDFLTFVLSEQGQRIVRESGTGALPLSFVDIAG